MASGSRKSCCLDDGRGEESEAEGDAHRAFAAALVKRDLGRTREPSGDQAVEPEAGFGDRTPAEYLSTFSPGKPHPSHMC